MREKGLRFSNVCWKELLGMRGLELASLLRRPGSPAKFILASGCVGPVVNRTRETAEVRGQRCYLRRREFSGGKGRGEMSAFTTAGF